MSAETTNMQKLTILLDDSITNDEKNDIKKKISSQKGKITGEPEIINALFVEMPKNSAGFAGLKALHGKIKDVEVDGNVSTQ
ncbi:hypothetical protein IWW36_002262 [Coemansia brasiliensis]|uniref:Uncharacterized protein n=1 Tax=Coemansia brasiliensis TaxID=2650707 RepID=A0A9W8M021_9FUNG|nr:hypothetical protein IWW36_002262 [Coemansia brasiliensis]